MTKILVVDDEPIDRELARRCLKAYDEELELRFACEGVEALEMMASDAPDVVLTDLRMPEMDGLALVEHIQQEHPLVPVILMTARGSEQIAVKALEAGAASYVPKEELRAELAETIEQVLELAESRRSREQILRFLGARKTHFSLINDIHLITPLVAYFQGSLERLGFGNEGVRTQIGMALMEAVANAMVRGNLEVGSELRATDRNGYDALMAERAGQEPYASRMVTCTATESTESVTYHIEDEGPGFNPDDVPDPTAAENLLAVSGRGIMLMRTFMDTVEFSERGNAVTMIKANPLSHEPQSD